MFRSRFNIAALATCLVLAASLAWAACDTVEPEETDRLVVEGFLDAGQPLPAVTLRRTRGLDEPYPSLETAVEDAAVTLTLDGRRIDYRAEAGQPGHYAAADGATVSARARYTLDVRWRDQHASAEGVIPPPIAIDSIRIVVPDEPVQALLRDSLRLDSLDTVTELGFIYAVEVSVWWRTDFAEVGADSLYWVRAQLKPQRAFSSTVVGLFLRSEQILRERTLPHDALSRRQWTGVYAVPVDAATDPLPPHRLQVALLRSSQDYARFASSRHDPDRREPVSNVTGALGIFAGISVDSLRVQVE